MNNNTIQRWMEIVEEQKQIIGALNSCIGGEGSTTTENLTLCARQQDEIERLREKLSGRRSINVNEHCTVILNEKGVEAINKYYSDLGLAWQQQWAVGDQYTSELWEIMNIFGPYIYMGGQPPFETNILMKGV